MPKLTFNQFYTAFIEYLPESKLYRDTFGDLTDNAGKLYQVFCQEMYDSYSNLWDFLLAHFYLNDLLLDVFCREVGLPNYWLSSLLSDSDKIWGLNAKSMADAIRTRADVVNFFKSLGINIKIIPYIDYINTYSYDRQYDSIYCVNAEGNRNKFLYCVLVILSNSLQGESKFYDSQYDGIYQEPYDKERLFRLLDEIMPAGYIRVYTDEIYTN